MTIEIKLVGSQAELQDVLNLLATKSEPINVKNQLKEEVKAVKKAAKAVEAPAEEEAPVAEKQPQPGEAITKATVTLDEVRAVVIEMSKTHKDELKQILTTFKANKLTELSPEYYEDFLNQIKQL